MAFMTGNTGIRMVVVVSIMLLPLITVAGTINCIVEFDQELIDYSKYRDFDVVSMEGLRYTEEVGRPQLPERLSYVALPPTDQVSDVVVSVPRRIPVHSALAVVPVQKPLPRNHTVGEDASLQVDHDIYSSSTIYPLSPVRVLGYGDLAGQRLAALSICPFEYNPVSGALFFTPRIHLSVHTSTGRDDTRSPVDTPPFSRHVITLYNNMLQDMVLNPEAVELEPAIPRNSAFLPPASVDHVIVTKRDWADDFQPLADWHMKKGMPGVVIDKEWITNNYSGSSASEKIRNFIEDAHSTWGTAFFLMGGDTDVIGSPSKRVNGYTVYSDSYYADFDEDWIEEVAVGRATVDNASQIQTFIDKTLYYEKTPFVGDDYPASAFFFAFDLDRDTKSEICKISIDDTYIPSHFKPIATEYDSEPGTHKTDSINYLNHGYNLVNHDDHSDATSLGVGSYRHWDYIHNSDMRSLSNGGRLSVFYTTGCHGNDFNKSEGIGEEFVRNAAGGGVGYIGNTHLGWYTPGMYNSQSYLYDKAFFKSLFTDNMYHQGMTLLDSKNDHYPSSDTYKHIWWELCLLGDPALPVWTDTPVDPDVSIPLQVNPGSHHILAQVSREGKAQKGALICVTDGEEVYERATTTRGGAAVFCFEDMQEGASYDVTITVQNCYPYESVIEIAEGPGLVLSIDPQSQSLARGDTLAVEVEVTNTSEDPVEFDYWADLTLLPSGFPYFDNPVFSVSRLTIPPGESGTGGYRHLIPHSAPYGTYTYTCRLGDRPGTIWNEFSFTFEVIPGTQHGDPS
jgi:hypothetical protein